MNLLSYNAGEPVIKTDDFQNQTQRAAQLGNKM